MPVKTVVRAIATTVLVCGSILGVSTAALAVPTPTPTPTTGAVPTYVEYTGHATARSTSAGFHSSGTLPSHIRIDCGSGSCVITELTIDDTAYGGGIIDMSQGEHLVLVDGRGSWQMPQLRTVCDEGYFGPGTLTIVATATGFTGTRTSTSTVSGVSCPNGQYGQSAPFTATATAQVSAGDPCVLDGSCPKPPPTPKPTAKPPAAAAPPPTIRPTHATRIDSPSTLSALPTTASAFTLHGILYAAAVTVVLVLLVAFPTYLLNSATSNGAARVREWWSKRRPRAAERLRQAREVEYRGWPFAAAGVLLASLISSFVDPTFGFNAASVRVYLSILLSFLLDAVVGWFLLIYLVRRVRPHTTANFQFSPASLLVVLGAVLFTRLTGFAPGIIFGLVARVVFGTILASAEKARVALVGLGYSFVVAIIGWVGYSAVTTSAGAHPGAWVVFLSETLSSMAVGGIAALPIALIPLRGLTGFDIFSWNRWVWAGAYAIGLLGFFVVLMPLPFAWSGVHVNLIIWIAVYVAYGLFSIGVWLAFARPWKRPDAPVVTETPEEA